MKRTTKLFVLIGIISLALGIGTGFLIKAAKENKAEPTALESTEAQADIIELPPTSESANPQGLAPAKKAPAQAPRAANNAVAIEAEDTQETEEVENAARTEMRERRYND